MTNTIKKRAQNAMIGLAVGDAVSWTSMFHRSSLLPPWTRRIRREMDAASETNNVILTPMPFSLNQPSHVLDVYPTVNTEWGAFTAGILLHYGVHSYSQSALKEWNSLAQSKEPIKGGVSTQAALANLRKGILPPQCGKENPHYFDDGAMSRAVIIGMFCAGQPEPASRIAEIDASFTNSEDGIWAAQAIAVAVSMVSGGKDIHEAVDSAKQFLPEGSWIRRTFNETVKITEKCSSIFQCIPDLHSSVVNREYSFGNIAPETLALTFVIALIHGDNFENAMAVTSCFPKSSETLPAMVGALVGAMHREPIVKSEWLNSVSILHGICIPSLSGKNYHTLTEQLSNAAGQKISL